MTNKKNNDWQCLISLANSISRQEFEHLLQKAVKKGWRSFNRGSENYLGEKQTIMRNIRKSISLFAFSLISKAQYHVSRLTFAHSKGIDSTYVDKNLLKGSGVKNIIVVYKNHFDLDYSGTPQKVVYDYLLPWQIRCLNGIPGNLEITLPNAAKYITAEPIYFSGESDEDSVELQVARYHLN